MFERITKREFIDLLKNHYSGLGVSRMNMSQKGNMIFTDHEHYDSFDECYLYDIIAYIIGKEVE